MAWIFAVCGMLGKDTMSLSTQSYQWLSKILGEGDFTDGPSLSQQGHSQQQANQGSCLSHSFCFCFFVIGYNHHKHPKQLGRKCNHRHCLSHNSFLGHSLLSHLMLRKPTEALLERAFWLNCSHFNILIYKSISGITSTQGIEPRKTLASIMFP